MHIPDGYLSPATCAVTYAAMVPAWLLASQRLKSLEGTRALSRVGLAAAFSFGLMMFNVPIPGGTTGHAVGTGLIAIALGPWAAILAVSATLLIQALMFGDGGITAFAANCLGMALVPAVGAWWIWRLFSRSGGRVRLAATAFAAAYIPVFIGSLFMAALLGIQPHVASDAAGLPRYFPFGLIPAITAIGVAHIFICLLEGAITATAVLVMAKMPEFASIFRPGASLAKAPWFRRKSAWVVALVMAVLIPAGVLLPEWAGAAEPWGEWSAEETAQIAGLSSVPDGMAKLSETWSAPVPDYAFSEPDTAAGATTQYAGAGLLGFVLIGLFFGGVQKLLMRRNGLQS